MMVELKALTVNSNITYLAQGEMIVFQDITLELGQNVNGITFKVTQQSLG